MFPPLRGVVAGEVPICGACNPSSPSPLSLSVPFVASSKGNARSAPLVKAVLARWSSPPSVALPAPRGPMEGSARREKKRRRREETRTVTTGERAKARRRPLRRRWNERAGRPCDTCSSSRIASSLSALRRCLSWGSRYWASVRNLFGLSTRQLASPPVVVFYLQFYPCDRALRRRQNRRHEHAEPFTHQHHVCCYHDLHRRADRQGERPFA